MSKRQRETLMYIGEALGLLLAGLVVALCGMEVSLITAGA